MKKQYRIAVFLFYTIALSVYPQSLIYGQATPAIVFPSDSLLLGKYLIQPPMLVIQPAVHQLLKDTGENTGDGFDDGEGDENFYGSNDPVPVKDGCYVLLCLAFVYLVFLVFARKTGSHLRCQSNKACNTSSDFSSVKVAKCTL
ncbi:MAG: hypothetical protein LBC40_09850 [Dysgonamonadaceae bacterium]|nr:hypothetical protein [Dysgonamonadaceae bacterium]